MIVMLVMAVLLLAGTTFMTISSTESQIALNERVSVQASLLAQAALHRAIATLDVASLSDGTTLTGSLGDSTFTATVTTTSTQTCPGGTAKDLLLTALVPVRGGQAQVQFLATADRISYPFRWGAFAVTDYVFLSSLWTKQTLTDSFDSTIGPYNATTNPTSTPPPNPLLPGGTGGNIGANGGLYLWYADVKGNARSGGWINSTESSASRPPVPNAPLEVLPDVVPPASTIPASVAPPAGNYPFDPGTYHFDSINSPTNTVLTTSTISQDPVTIYVTGPMTMGNGATFTTNGSPVTIYVTGPLTLGDNVVFLNNQSTTPQVPVTIYAAGQIKLGNNVTLGSPNLTLGSPPATNFTMITKSDGDATQQAYLTTGSNFRLFGSLYGKNTTVILGDNAEVYGSIIGRKITRGVFNTSTGLPEEFSSLTSWWQNPPKFHFDQAMYDKAICLNTSNGKYAIRRGSWREVIP